MFFSYYQRPSFTPMQNYRQNYSFVYLIFTFLDSKWEDKALNWMVASITWI
jgi:hypothetical protein